MRIVLTPQRRDDGPLTLVREGERLTIAGITCDFSDLPEGGRRSPEEAGSPFLAADVVRKDGRLTVTLILPVGHPAPPEALDPAPIDDPPDGPVALPPTRAAEAGEAP